MAKVGVGEKYHIALDGQGYLLSVPSYHKRNARSFINRFNTGQLGENDLDLFKVWSQKNFDGGLGQEYFDDESKVSDIRNAVTNPLDFLLYPTPEKTDYPFYSFGALGQEENNFWTMWYESAGSQYNPRLLKWDPQSATFSNITPPGNYMPRGVAEGADHIMFCCSDLTRISGDGGATWSTNGAISGIPIWYNNAKKFVIADANNDAYIMNNLLYTHSGIATEAFVLAGSVGKKSFGIRCLAEYNHRIMIGKQDGLFAFDNVVISKVAKYNVKSMSEFNGALYFVEDVTNILYRFNGSTIEKIHQFPKYLPIADMSSDKGRLYLRSSAANLDVPGAKFGWTNGKTYLFYYDGLGVKQYAEFSTDGLVYDLKVNDGYIFMPVKSVSSPAQECPNIMINSNNEFTGVATNTLQLTTSILDFNLPNVDKYGHTFEVETENFGLSDLIQVSYRTYDGKAWSVWQLLDEAINSNTEAFGFRKVFKKVQFQVLLSRSSTSAASIKSLNLKYAVMPEKKWEWQFSLDCTGSTNVPLVLLDGTEETVSAIQLREKIQAANESKEPVGFEDIDFSRLSAPIDDSVTVIPVISTYGSRTVGKIKVDDEIISFTGKTPTSFTGCIRGDLGTVAAAHSDQALVNSYYEVIVDDITDISVSDPTPDPSGIESAVTVTIKEV